MVLHRGPCSRWLQPTPRARRSAVTGGPPRTAAAITNGKMTYSTGWCARRRAKHLAEDEVRREHRAAHEQARFRPLAARPGHSSGTRQDHGRDDERSESVAQPPIRPECLEPAPGLNGRRAQRRDTPIVALSDVLMTPMRMNASTSRMRRSVGSKPGSWRSAHATATASRVFPVATVAAVQTGAACRHSRRRRRPRSQARAPAPQQKRRDGDSGGSPDGRDLLGDERKTKSQIGGDHIGDRHGNTYRRQPASVTERGWVLWGHRACPYGRM